MYRKSKVSIKFTDVINKIQDYRKKCGNNKYNLII